MVQNHFTARIGLAQNFSAQFHKDILKEINNKLSAVLPAAVNSIKRNLGEMVRARIMASPEYAARGAWPSRRASQNKCYH
jgi:hypothetical protein